MSDRLNAVMFISICVTMIGGFGWVIHWASDKDDENAAKEIKSGPCALHNGINWSRSDFDKMTFIICEDGTPMSIKKLVNEK